MTKLTFIVFIAPNALTLFIDWLGGGRYTHVIQALGRLSQEDQEFKAILPYIVILRPAWTTRGSASKPHQTEITLFYFEQLPGRRI